MGYYVAIESKEKMSERHQVDLIKVDPKEFVEKDSIWSLANLKRLTPEEIVDRIEQINDQAFLYTSRLLWELRDRFPSDIKFGQYIEKIKNHPTHPVKLGKQPRTNKMLHVGRFCNEYDISDISKIGILQSVIVELARPFYREVAGAVLHEIRRKNLKFKDAVGVMEAKKAVFTIEKQEKSRQLLIEQGIEDDIEIDSKSEEVDLSNSSAFSERELYPLLMQYLEQLSGYKLRPKRINESTSSNADGKGANAWLHPDVVAMEEPNFHSISPRMWSFEVKPKLDRAHLREYFFQTVANSSWANFGYLVAPDIDDKVIDELKILSKAYQIGVIKLNTENPFLSVMTFPAHDKSSYNPELCDRLVKENSNFREFIQKAEDCYSLKKVPDEPYWKRQSESH